MHEHTNNRGSAMLAALAVLLMLSLLGIAAINTSTSDMNIAENYQTGVQAFYIAEAGAEYGYAIIRDTVTWRAGLNDQSFGDGTFRVIVVDSASNTSLDDSLIVFSIGRRRETVKMIELKLAPIRPFGWSAFADDALDVCGGSTTDSYNSDSGSYAMTRLNTGGDLGSNGSVDICGTTQVNGDASTSSPGDMEISGSGVVNGDTTTTAPRVDLSPIPADEIQYAQDNNGAPAGFAGTYSYNPGTNRLLVDVGETLTLSSGTYYFTRATINGTLKLQPGAKVKIYITDDFRVQDTARVNSDGQPANLQIFGTGGEISFAGQADIRAALYAPEADIKLAGGVDLYGAFVGNTITDVGSSSYHYDRALRALKLPAIMEKVAWREILGGGTLSVPSVAEIAAD